MFHSVGMTGVEPACPKNLIYSQASQPNAQHSQLLLRSPAELFAGQQQPAWWPHRESNSAQSPCHGETLTQEPRPCTDFCNLNLLRQALSQGEEISAYLKVIPTGFEPASPP